MQQTLSSAVERKIFYEKQIETLKAEVELLKGRKNILYSEILKEEKSLSLFE